MASINRLFYMEPGTRVRLCDKLYEVVARIDASLTCPFRYLHRYCLKGERGTLIWLNVNEYAEGSYGNMLELWLPIQCESQIPSFGEKMPYTILHDGACYYGDMHGVATRYQFAGELEGHTIEGGLICLVNYIVPTVRDDNPKTIQFVSFNAGKVWKAFSREGLSEQDVVIC